MRHQSVLGALAVIAMSSAAFAENQDGTASKDSEVTIETDALVSGRRAGFWMSAGLFGGMFGVIESGGEAKGLSFAAGTLAGWAKAMPGMFPDGSVNEKSNALPAVWNDREGFLATAALYQERTAKLAELAKAGDNAGFKAQWAVVRETCNTCHETYRKKREKAAK